jgi:putative ABC transport system permease protein
MLRGLGLASRNLLRNRRRTAIGLCAIGFGVVALLLAGGFIEWNLWALRESTIHSRLGHVQLVKPGYFEYGSADPFAYLLPDRPQARDEIARLPHVAAVAPRLAFTGLVSRGETTISFLGEGVAPELETKLSRDVTILAGSALSDEAPDGILLGKGLATNLGAVTGDTVVLLAKTASGSLSGFEAKVRGIFFTSSKAYDDVALRARLATVQTLLRTPGVHAWIVLLDRTESTDAVLARLRERSPGDKAGLEIVPWHRLADYYRKVEELFGAQLNVLRLIIAAIIVASISNILVMSVMERTAEIGTLMAIGSRKRRVLELFLSEGLVLGLAGAALGVVIGYVLAMVISRIGIPMPPAPGTDFSYRGEILVTWDLAASSFLIAALSTMSASVFPAWKASRLNVVDALRYAR